MLVLTMVDLGSAHASWHTCRQFTGEAEECVDEYLSRLCWVAAGE